MQKSGGMRAPSYEKQRAPESKAHSSLEEATTPLPAAKPHCHQTGRKNLEEYQIRRVHY